MSEYKEIIKIIKEMGAPAHRFSANIVITYIFALRTELEEKERYLKIAEGVTNSQERSILILEKQLAEQRGVIEAVEERMAIVFDETEFDELDDTPMEDLYGPNPLLWCYAQLLTTIDKGNKKKGGVK